MNMWEVACAWMDEQNLNDKDEQLLFKTKKPKIIIPPIMISLYNTIY